MLVAGGGLAGLVTAAACHSKGMKVALFEQASSYAPYGGPIQIQSNALRAIQRINPQIYEDLVQAGTCTADRVSGLKIGYKRGNKLAGLYDKGDWLVRFDTLGPALEAELPPTVVVDRPVIQQIFVKHGFPADTVRIKSRVVDYEDRGGCVKVTLEDGTEAFGDVLVGADGVWSSVRKIMHGLDEGAGGDAASGAAGGALDEAEARKMARHGEGGPEGLEEVLGLYVLRGAREPQGVEHRGSLLPNPARRQEVLRLHRWGRRAAAVVRFDKGGRGRRRPGTDAGEPHAQARPIT